MPYRDLADLVLAIHMTLAIFVVGGLILVVAGNLCGWQWVNRRGFRFAHLAAVAVIVAEAWFGIACPLTTVEMWLRARADGGGYRGGFVEHWLGQILYLDAPGWVFVVAYSLFGLVTVTVWLRFPPAARRPGSTSGR